MAKANLSLISNRAGDTEGLEALSDGCGSVSGLTAAFLNGNGCTHCICPAGILKADGLDLLYLVVDTFLL